MIEFKNVVKRFGKKIAVNGLSMTMGPGTTTMLIGPSGCGKTTTLRMINRLIDADGGDILIDGRSVRELDPVDLRRSIGYAIQETGLFPHMDVYGNIAAVPRLLGWPEKRIRARVAELLDLVTLDQSFGRKYPLQLSGGEAQRVGIARALAADPAILLMDEPFGAIDPINRSRLHELFEIIQGRIRKTIVFVTHDINEAIKLGDRIAVLESGSLVQYDDTQRVLDDPANEFVERLLGSDRKLKGLILKRAGDHAKPDGYGVASPEDSREKLARLVAAAPEGFAAVVGGDGRLKGVYTMPTANGRPLFNASPLAVDESADLLESLSVMVSAGDSRVLVVSADGALRGVLRLADISGEIGGSPRKEGGA